MRTLLFLLTILVSGSAVAGGLPSPGRFTGTGRYIGPDGAVGTYDVTASVEGAKVTCTYTYQDGSGSARRETVTLEFAADGSFTVGRELGNDKGRGRCDGALCSYAMEFPGGQVMELLRFTPDGIEKVGSKKFSNMSVSWSETLNRAP